MVAVPGPVNVGENGEKTMGALLGSLRSLTGFVVRSAGFPVFPELWRPISQLDDGSFAHKALPCNIMHIIIPLINR
jgi:hypothetical protein